MTNPLSQTIEGIVTLISAIIIVVSIVSCFIVYFDSNPLMSRTARICTVVAILVVCDVLVALLSAISGGTFFASLLSLAGSQIGLFILGWLIVKLIKNHWNK